MDREISKHLVEKLSHRLGRLFVMKFIDPNHEFDSLYYDFRKHEGRIYSDDELERLPLYNGANKKLAKEWKGRKHAADMLIDYLKTNRPEGKMNILDLGCGVGWLSNRFSDIPDTSVYAIDIVQEELVQASKVFDKTNLQFVYGNFYREIIPEKSVNVVVLSGCVEFFPNLKTLFTNIQKVLKPGGEIHIINSPFYKKEVVEKEEQKMYDYFEKSGFTLMKRHYFHHTFETMKSFGVETMYDPDKLGKKLSRSLIGSTETPHFWYRIKKDS